MKVLVGCEESQIVCKAFRALGHEAYSCDLLPCSGGHPEWHFQQDVFETLSQYGPFDLCVFHPPCTYLTVTANKWMKPEFKNRFPDREKQRQDAIDFFMALTRVDCDKIAIENPVGIMSTKYRKPDQYVHPYFFGDPQSKKTGLWLKGLPKLIPTNMVEPEMYTYKKDGRKDPMWHVESLKLPPAERARVRGRTFPGFARAMSIQWST
jgi:hypothetical protein